MKIIRVKSCNECPYIQYYRPAPGYGENAECTVSFPKRSVTEYADRRKIPKWCPLEDDP